EAEGVRHYCPHRVPMGFSLMFGAGALSGLLGIGSGAVKVLAMDQAMRIPFKVSTTTSNFMIGVTAAASAGIYLNRGYIDPGLAMPVMLGVLTGSLIGTRILVKAETKSLRLVFSAIILLLGAQMLYNGVAGRIWMSQATRWAAQRVEDIIGNLLGAGRIFSALVVFVGAVVYLAPNGQDTASSRI